MVARKRRAVTNLTFMFVCSVIFSIFLFASNAGANPSPWNDWKNRCMVVLSETAGEDRINEPVEVTVELSGTKADGSDIRVIDDAEIEVPYQIVEKGPDGIFTMAFFANVPKQSSKNYFILYNNPEAGDPAYDKVSSAVDNKARTWQTNDVFIQWGGKAGYYVDTTRPITALKFDDSGLGIPAKAVDRITDDWNNWDPDMSYGYLGSNLSGSNPYGFGSETGSIVTNGPVFSEFKLGSALIRSYKGKKNWIVANGSVDSLLMFGHWYNREKHGGAPENIIKDNGPGGGGPHPIYYSSANINPLYMCFRRTDIGLVFGALGINTASWYISAKESGGYDRTISFNDSVGRPDAKIYWYSDTSNGYARIESFSRQVLNPLKVNIVADTEPPVTTISVTPEKPDGLNDWYVTNPQVALSSNEDGTTYYQLDNAAALVYSEPIIIPEGRHVLSCYSVDVFGNKEQPKIIKFSVDVASPDAPVLLLPADGTLINESTPTYSWDAGHDENSGLSHYDLYIDNIFIIEDIGVSEGEISSPELNDGLHKWFIRAYDQAGNFADSQVFELTIDTTPSETKPGVTPTGPDGQSGWYIAEPSLCFSTNETSTIYYCFDSDEHQVYESTITVPEGIHEISYHSVDSAGNREDEKSLELKVDCSQPEINASIQTQHPDNLYVTGEPITFTYSATDCISGIESIFAKVDDEVISNDASLSFEVPGDHKFEVIAIDAAGNKSSLIKEFTVTTIYDFKWLPPVSKKCDSEGKTHGLNHRSTIPIKFAVFGSAGRFITDESVMVVVSDGIDTAVFTYGTERDDIKIKTDDEQYLLHLCLKDYAWLEPGDKCKVSVYFGGGEGSLGILQGEVTFELK